MTRPPRSAHPSAYHSRTNGLVLYRHISNSAGLIRVFTLNGSTSYARYFEFGFDEPDDDRPTLCSSRALNYPGRLGSFGAAHHHRGRVILGVATLKGRTVFIGYGAMTRYRSKGPRCVGKEE